MTSTNDGNSYEPCTARVIRSLTYVDQRHRQGHAFWPQQHIQLYQLHLPQPLREQVAQFSGVISVTSGVISVTSTYDDES